MDQITTEDIVNVTAASGTNSITVRQNLKPGRIVGVVRYKSANDNNNPGMVSAQIKNHAGVAVSEMQHIDNYRSREAGYVEGAKPLFMEGGRQVEITITASDNFTADLLTQWIFIYDTTNCIN